MPTAAPGGLRGLPDGVKTALEILPADTHPMDVMRTGASVLGTLEQENDPAEQQHDVADRLLAASVDAAVLVPLHARGKRIEVETDDETVGGHFLHLLHGEKPSEDASRPCRRR